MDLDLSDIVRVLTGEFGKHDFGTKPPDLDVAIVGASNEDLRGGIHGQAEDDFAMAKDADMRTETVKCGWKADVIQQGVGA
jgi:hypothetical protein